MSMFQAATNVVVHGGTQIAAGHGSTVHIHQDRTVLPAVSEALRYLSEKAAHTALHDSSARYNAPRCHRNTRAKQLDRLELWILGSGEEWQGKRFMWLHGGAGAGKSAIMQSIIERCMQHGMVLGSFFFSKSDNTRNYAEVLIPTLAYQLARAYPEALVVLEQVITRDPLVFKASLLTQTYHLLVRPLLHLVQNGALTHHPRESLGIFVIDGLDECEEPKNQALIINVISTLLTEHALPVSFLVASRPELAIQSEYRRQARLHGTLATMALDHDADAEADIRQYINDACLDILQFHPLGNRIRRPWPSKRSIDTLVRRSSGHFIYAATAMQFIASHSEHPVRALKVVEGLMPSRGQSPFSELDALYHHILTSAKHSTHVISILRWCFIPPLKNTVDLICYALDICPDDLEVYLSDVQALVSIGPENTSRGDIAVQPKHASLKDFLGDEARSKALYISMGDYYRSLLPRLIELLRESPRFFSKGQYETCYRITPNLMANRGHNCLVHSICNAIEFSNDNIALRSLLDGCCLEDVWKLSVNDRNLYEGPYDCVADEIRSTSVGDYMSAILSLFSDINSTLYLRHFPRYMHMFLRNLNNSKEPANWAIPALLFSCDTHSLTELVFHIFLTVIPRISGVPCLSCSSLHTASPQCLYLYHLVDTPGQDAKRRVSEALDNFRQHHISRSWNLAGALRLLLHQLRNEPSTRPFRHLNRHKSWLSNVKPLKHIAVGSPTLSQHVYYYQDFYPAMHDAPAGQGKSLVLGSPKAHLRVYGTFPRWEDIYEFQTAIDAAFIRYRMIGSKKTMHKSICVNGYRCILILRAIIVFLRKAECTKELVTLARKSLPRVCLWFPDLLREARAELDAYVRRWQDSIGGILEKAESMTISELD